MPMHYRISANGAMRTHFELNWTFRDMSQKKVGPFRSIGALLGPGPGHFWPIGALLGPGPGRWIHDTHYAVFIIKKD